MPANTLLLGLAIAVDCHLHPIVKHAVRLVVVRDVEAHSVASLGVRASKEEPLRVALRVDIVLHQAIVLVFGDFLCKEEVAGLEPRLKY